MPCRYAILLRFRYAAFIIIYAMMPLLRHYFRRFALIFLSAAIDIFDAAMAAAAIAAAAIRQYFAFAMPTPLHATLAPALMPSLRFRH